MTKNLRKRAAEGPFRKKEGLPNDKLSCADIQVCYWDDSFHMTDTLNEHLALWLKTTSGKRWMEDNGVGGK